MFGRARMTGLLLTGAAGLLFASAGTAGTLVPDRIVLRSTQISQVNIVEADVYEIVYTRFGGGDRKTVPADQVVRISWGDAGTMNLAISEYEKGNWKEALQTLKKLPETGPREFWYGPYRRLLQGKCLLKLRKPADALTLFTEAARRYPRSFYVLEAIENKARAHLALRQYAKAADAFALFDPSAGYAAAGSAAPYGKLWQWRGRINQAEAYTKVAGKSDEAARIFGNLVRVIGAALAKLPKDLRPAEAEIKVIYERALIGQATAVLKGGDPEEALKLIDPEKIESRTARAKMYMALGDLLMKAAESQAPVQKKVRLKQSLFQYMRVYIVYREQKSERPRAMLAAATASRLLGTPGDNGRAVRLYKEIIAEFAGTADADEAKKALEAMGVK